MSYPLAQHPYQDRLLTTARYFLLAWAIVIPLSTSLTVIFYLISAGLILLSGKPFQQSPEIWNHPIARSLLLLAAALLLSLSYTVAPWHSALSGLQKYSWLVLTPIIFVALDDSTWGTFIWRAFLSSLLIMLVLSYGKYFGLHNIGKNYGGVSVFKSHIVQSYFTTILALSCAYRAISKQKYRRLFACLSVLAIINTCFLSTGRTGYGLLIIGFCFFSYKMWSWRGIAAAAFIGLSLFAMAYMLSSNVHLRVNTAIHSYQQHKQGKSYNSVGIRLVMLKNGTYLARRQPILGYGVGSIQKIYSNLPKDSAKLNNIKYLEMTYLNIALQLGLIGLLLFAYLFTNILKNSSKLPAEAAFTIQACTLLYLLGAFINPWFHTITLKHFLSMLLLSHFQLSENAMLKSKIFMPAEERPDIKWHTA